MPTYEYRCNECGHRFEAWLRSLDSAAPEECPNCKAPQIRRVPSLFGKLKTAAGSVAGACGYLGGT